MIPQTVVVFSVISSIIPLKFSDVIQMSNRPRPMTFDPNQHKVLNAELKRLYTAVTRARVNVWIFDEDMEKRAPMFEYFKARKLTRNSSEVENGK